MTETNRRIVITGMGAISPIGNSADEIWKSLNDGVSGIDFLQRVPPDHLPSKIGGEASAFTGDISDFGDLEKKLKRTIKKGLKLMCREIEMGVAAAQHAIAGAGLVTDTYAPERIGTMFGSDYIITEPFEFSSGVKNCMDDENQFDFGVWGERGLSQVEPLWLLKYLPNMPASHVAIYNDFRGPSNSLTVREASANLAIAEATTILRRGIADVMVVGSTGSRIHPVRTVHTALQEQLAQCEQNGDTSAAAKASCPFDSKRSGMVMGEGAGCVILEDYESAKNRGATIYAEVVAYGSSTVADRKYVADYHQAFSNVLQTAIETVPAEEIGHVNAHGLSSIRCDQEEAQAIKKWLGADKPVVAPKSNMGNLGAGGGLVELIASVCALQKGHLFPTLNYNHPDDQCPVRVITDNDTDAGSSFINLNITPQGQASAVVVKKAQ